MSVYILFNIQHDTTRARGELKQYRDNYDNVMYASQSFFVVYEKRPQMLLQLTLSCNVVMVIIGELNLISLIHEGGLQHYLTVASPNLVAGISANAGNIINEGKIHCIGVHIQVQEWILAYLINFLCYTCVFALRLVLVLMALF